MSTNLDEEADLGARLRAGDLAALGRLYEREMPGLYDFARRIVRDQAAAEDVVQNTFVRAFERRETLRDPARVKAWLYTIAHRLALDTLSRGRRIENVDDQPDVRSPLPGPEEEVAREDVAALVWAAASSLEPRQYAVLDLSVRRGLTTPEIAEALGVKSGHAAVLLNRAKEALENAMRFLMVARRRDRCDRLAALVPAGVRSLTPAQRTSVDHHLRHCETCRSEAARALVPAELLGALPLFALPRRLEGSFAQSPVAARLTSSGSDRNPPSTSSSDVQPPTAGEPQSDGGQSMAPPSSARQFSGQSFGLGRLPGFSRLFGGPGGCLVKLLALLVTLAVIVTALIFGFRLGQPTYQCTGSAFQLFDNSNVYGVGPGGQQPTFSTNGQTYCLDHLVTYHWNNGTGSRPGSIGLHGSAGTLGPWAAVGSSGQGGAANVNWTATPGTQVIISGTYACVDSNPSTWSQNLVSHLQGFCHVWVRKATGGHAVVASPTPTPVALHCTGARFKLFDNWNGGGVLNGGKPTVFDTGGKSYCLQSIDTYHWNNGLGQHPGTIGLRSSSGAIVGPWPATGSAGQGGAPNVNWTAIAPSSPPLIINGSYTCVDSDPTTWSQNQQSGGQGFCDVYVYSTI